MAAARTVATTAGPIPCRVRSPGGRAVRSVIGGGRSLHSAIGGGRSLHPAIGGGRPVRFAIGGGRSLHPAIGGGRPLRSAIGSGRTIWSVITSASPLRPGVSPGRPLRAGSVPAEVQADLGCRQWGSGGGVGVASPAGQAKEGLAETQPDAAG